eukprot:TRINITY_DN17945_c0_g1_i2.p1 TRINITY_DN17945_c0_g1~~TRINITY_DN17945_c0_g1_i2.p1  ORF type:complete len:216 (-),score=49.38 TRINITY_DN17945_c0_g1_i2:242-889(-)
MGNAGCNAGQSSGPMTVCIRVDEACMLKDGRRGLRGKARGFFADVENEEVLPELLATQQLLMSARDGDHITAKVLLRRGINANVRDTAHILTLNNDDAYRHESPMLEVVEDDERHCFGMTPLMHAAQQGHDRVVRALLEAGAEVNACDEDHMTALHFAASGGHEHVVLLLRHWTANVDARDLEGRLPIDYIQDKALGRAAAKRMRQALAENFAEE